MSDALSFARPDVLWLLLVLPLMAFVHWATSGAKRRALVAFGPQPPGEVGGPRRHARRYAYTANVCGVLSLILAVAGPRWGRVAEPGVVRGRDVIAVLDLSRSMLARDLETPIARWEAARDALKALADAVERRGGHRLALVVFAGRAKVVVPLTTDYDHFRRKLDELEGLYPPPEIAPGAVEKSGTRFGAAIERAASLVDAQFPRATDIVLVSDGDDPAFADGEWQLGVIAARTAGVPVHTAGVGDVNSGSFIPLGTDDVVEGPDGPIRTKLYAEHLERIADQSGGQYVPGPMPSVGEFFRSQIEPRGSRELDADALPQPAPRQVWFFGVALVFLIASQWWELRRTPPRGRHANPVVGADADGRRAAVAR